MNISTNSKITTSNQLTENEIKSLKYWVSGPEDGIDYPVIEDDKYGFPAEWFEQQSIRNSLGIK